MINDNTTRFKYIWFVLFYITFIFVAIIYSYQVFSDFEIDQASWQDVASYDFDLVDQTFEGGVLTNTYGISTPEQLAGMFMINESVEKQLNDASFVYADSMTSVGKPNNVKYINSEYILLNDVDMLGRSWTPSTFSSVFNGNYHVISNLEIKSSGYKYLGMVSELRSTTTTNGVATNGIIKNLYLKNINVANSYSSSVETYTGAVAGFCRGRIENVFVLSGSVTGSAYKGHYDRCAGGIAGNMDSYIGISPNIINCKNYASITSAKFSGGIVGRINSGTVKNCYNYASISNGTNDRPRAGGITAESYGTIQLCVNYGSVTSTTTPEGGGDVRAGGIVGYTDKPIDQCANYGDVNGGSSNASASYIGGIAGYTESTIRYSYNTGDINSNAKVTTLSTTQIDRPNAVKNSTEKDHTGHSTSSDYTQSDILNGTLSDMKTFLNNGIRKYGLTFVYMSFPDNMAAGLGYLSSLGFATGNIDGGRMSAYDTDEDIELFMMLRGDYSIKKEDKKAYAGGLTGYSTKDIEYCYSTSSVVGGYSQCTVASPVWFLFFYYVFGNSSVELKYDVDLITYRYNLGQYHHGAINGNTTSTAKYTNCSANSQSTSLSGVTFDQYKIIGSTSTQYGSSIRVQFELDNKLSNTSNYAGHRVFLFPTIIWNNDGTENGIGNSTWIVKDHATRTVGWWPFQRDVTYSVRELGPHKNQVIFGGFTWTRTNGNITGMTLDNANTGYFGNILLSNVDPAGESKYDFHYCDYYGNPTFDTLKDYFTIFNLNDFSSEISDFSTNSRGKTQYSDMSSFGIPSYFAVSSNINNGNPYLKNLYW